MPAKLGNAVVGIQVFKDPGYNTTLWNLWKAGLRSTWGDGLIAQGHPEDEVFQESAGVNYDTFDVPMRLESFQTYTGGQNRTFSLTFEFFAESSESGGSYDHTSASISWSPQVVYDAACWLDHLKNSAYDVTTGLTYPPPPVILKVGSMLVARCVMTDGNPQWKGPYEVGTGDNPLMSGSTASGYGYGCTYSATFTTVRASRQSRSSYASLLSNVPESRNFLTF